MNKVHTKTIHFVGTQQFETLEGAQAYATRCDLADELLNYLDKKDIICDLDRSTAIRIVEFFQDKGLKEE